MASDGRLTSNILREAIHFYEQLPVATAFLFQVFHEGGPYHMETSPLIPSANQWTGLRDLRHERVKALIGFIGYLKSVNESVLIT